MQPIPPIPSIPEFKNLNPWLKPAHQAEIKKLQRWLLVLQAAHESITFRLELNSSPPAVVPTLEHCRNMLTEYANKAFQLERELQNKSPKPQRAQSIRLLTTQIRVVLDQFNAVQKIDPKRSNRKGSKRINRKGRL